MIPLLNLLPILRILHIFHDWVQRQRLQRLTKDIMEEQELLEIFNLLDGQLTNYLQYFEMILNFFKISRNHKRRRLTKPHILITLLNGYRLTVNNMDVWQNMETNWSHFFWLTGETPETLQILINRIEVKFLNYRTYGPDSTLSIRKQVSADSYVRKL